MLSVTQRILFAVFTCATLAMAWRAWKPILAHLRAGRADTEPHADHLTRRLRYALITTITQRRTFRRRPWISFFHALIFYGFSFYLAVNVIDALGGYVALPSMPHTLVGAAYHLMADLLSGGVLLGVVALLVRRFAAPAKRDLRFYPRTLLQPAVAAGAVARDSILVSGFILLHVGARLVGAAARLRLEGGDAWQPLATIVSAMVPAAHAHMISVACYWLALGSVLLFLSYFPRSKHLHLFAAPANYFIAREQQSGTPPPLALDFTSEVPELGAATLQNLAWPRLLDGYACIQCNRCQDACPAAVTGKALSPAALEINKRVLLNAAASSGDAQPVLATPLLGHVLSLEAAWACTTCGACLDVCPVQDEPMLDILDVRRQQVMLEGAFPSQLQSMFRGLERNGNPWGLSPQKRMDWAVGLNVPTVETNPAPEVLYWVGCAPSYDPQSQQTARAFVQLMQKADVDFAVLGTKECCTGDSARRAGNEYLYRQLADRNVATLNELRPKKIVTTCPHCMNSLKHDYAQLGGNYEVEHHTVFLDRLMRDGRLTAKVEGGAVAFHDPCYLGRHNAVYEEPRQLLHVLRTDVRELPRARDASFCCGAGGAQFWKEEEAGDQRIADNRMAEVQRALPQAGDAVLAVGCPFCKVTLKSATTEGTPPAVMDVAELLLRAVQATGAELPPTGVEARSATVIEIPTSMELSHAELPTTESASALLEEAAAPNVALENYAGTTDAAPTGGPADASLEAPSSEVRPSAPTRKQWKPKRGKGDSTL